MGALIEGLDVVAAAEQRGMQTVGRLRDEEISRIMDNFGSVMDEAEFVGDPEVALLHHFGQTALFDRAATKPYLDLVRYIQKKAGSEPVPVIIDFAKELDEFGEVTTRATSFTMVPLGELALSSKVDRTEGLKINWGSPKKVGVTDRVLALPGITTEIKGSMIVRKDTLQDQPQLHPPLFPSPTQWSPELTLRSTSIADGGQGFGGRVVRGENTRVFHDKYQEPLNPETKPRILVGWDYIQHILLNDIISVSGQGVQEAIRIEGYFAMAENQGISDILTAMGNNAPGLIEVFNPVRALQRAVRGVSRY